VENNSDGIACFLWIRKAYEPLEGYTAKSFVTRDQDVEPGTNGARETTRFVAPDDLAHDMHVNIVTFEPGASIHFAETHVMEHGLFVLEGKGIYLLNDDWVEVEAGDFMWLRAFCPQVCYASGPGRFRYLLYKDVNRQIRLT
jgi:(S)-ureidoglycine aminohydrolase